METPELHCPMKQVPGPCVPSLGIVPLKPTQGACFKDYFFTRLEKALNLLEQRKGIIDYCNALEYGVFDKSHLFHGF